MHVEGQVIPLYAVSRQQSKWLLTININFVILEVANYLFKVGMKITL